MDKDYQNFRDRMGSFENILETPVEELKHTGKLGMKWGHRKSITPATVGAAARTGTTITGLGSTVNKSRYSRKALQTAKHMSDEDLKRITTRMNLENNYANAKNTQTGRGKVETFLSISGGALMVASSAAVLYDVIKKARSV